MRRRLLSCDAFFIMSILPARRVAARVALWAHLLRRQPHLLHISDDDAVIVACTSSLFRFSRNFQPSGAGFMPSWNPGTDYHPPQRGD